MKKKSRLYLPSELLPGILSNLPVKSLLRFRCVSRSWESLIKDPEFARLHLKTFKNNRDETHLFAFRRLQRNVALRRSDTFKIDSEKLLTIGLPNKEGCWFFVCSIDGLVLLRRSKRKPTSEFWDLKVWNPSIRKFHEFPSLPSPDNKFKDADVCLGYDSSANDYKHVKLIFSNYITVHSVAIYSLGSGSWNLIPFQGKGCSWHWDIDTIKWINKVSLGGSLYFLADDVDQQHVSDLVWFDLSSEVFSSISLPTNDIDECLDEVVLMNSGCSVVLIANFSPKMVIWVLESSRDGSESMCWTKHYKLNLTNFHFLYLKKNGDFLTMRSFRKKRAWLYQLGSYNPDTGEYKILEEKEDSGFSITNVSTYIESLITLNY